MKTHYQIILSILLLSCQWSNADLGDSYYYLDKYEAKDIGFPDGAIIYKSETKNLFKDVKISKEVVEVKHNDNFIFAKQLANANRLDTSYYIIDKVGDKVYGPLTKDSCNHLRIELRTDL